jgi:hypothetical protein
MRLNVRGIQGVVSAAYFFLLYVTFSLLAPCRPAFGQGFEVASGDNSVGEPPVSYALLGTNYSFGRNATAHASMFRTNNAGFQSVGSTMSENSMVTLFSTPTSLFSFTGTAFHSLSGGVDSKSWSFFLNVPDAVSIPGSGSDKVKLKPKVTGEQDVSISPKVTISHDFGILFGVPVGDVGFDIELDVSVHLKTVAHLVWDISYPADGEDVTKSLDTKSTATVSKEVKLLKIGIAILEIELKLEGKAKFDLSDTSLKLDEHPRFTALTGEVDSTITAMVLTFEGAIVVTGSITLPIVGKKQLAKFELKKFDPLSVSLGEAKKVLFKK